MTILQALYSQKTIDRFSSQSDLSARNHEKIFAYNDKIWFVDDTNVYRVRIDETSEANPTEKPINGAVFMFNPKTGQLFIRIVHTSEWAGLKSYNRLSEWRFAEKVANQLTRSKSLPVEQRPDQFIPATYKWIEGVDMGKLLDFTPTIVIRYSKLNLPFKACLKIKKFRDLIMNATKPDQFLEFNLYDDWLLKRTNTSMSSYTAFSRLILILRALIVNEETAKMVLNPDEKIITEPNHIWPSLTDEQWMNVEVGLRNLIISDFAMKNNIVNASILTHIQVRNIILGEPVKITPPQRHRQPTVDTKNDKVKAWEIAPLQQQQPGIAKLLALLKNKMVSFLFRQKGINF